MEKKRMSAYSAIRSYRIGGARKMNPKLWQFIRRALQWVAASFGIGAVVAFLVYVAAGRNGDLVAWCSDVTPIYPSEQTKYLSLPLFLSGKPVKTLTFVNMQISNAGKGEIGSQDKLWTVDITGPPQAMLTLIGAPQPSSNRLVVTPAASPSANLIAVQVGILQQRDFFGVRFIVANAPDVSCAPSLHPSFKVATSLPGWSKPILTEKSPTESAAFKIVPYLFVAFVVFLVAIAIVEKYRRHWVPQSLRWPQDWGLCRKVVMGFVGALLLAYCLAFAIGWIAVTLWQQGVLS